MNTSSVRFHAVILQNGSINAAFIEFPFSAEEVFGKKGRIKVKVVFDGRIEYRGSLARMKTECHILGITRDIRQQLGKTFGDKVSVSVTEDLEERTVEMPDDILSVLVGNPEAKALFDAMNYTHRKEYIRWISEAKKPETRENRKKKMIEMILSGKKGV